LVFQTIETLFKKLNEKWGLVPFPYFRSDLSSILKQKVTMEQKDVPYLSMELNADATMLLCDAQFYLNDGRTNDADRYSRCAIFMAFAYCEAAINETIHFAKMNERCSYQERDVLEEKIATTKKGKAKRINKFYSLEDRFCAFARILGRPIEQESD